MRVVFILSLFSLWYSLGFAQLPKDFRTEQIYLELGKTEWNPGDTLEVNGVVTCLAANRFLPYSNYLYIELLNSQDSVLVRQRVDCKREEVLGHEFLRNEFILAPIIYALIPI